MKKLFFILSLTGLFFLLTANSCRKHKPQEQLPPETQTGAGTLGFKVNGIVYKSQAPYPNAFATYLYENFPIPGQQGYFFNVGGESLHKWYTSIQTDSLQIFEGLTYRLNNNFSSKGTAYAVYVNTKEHYTKPNLQGQLVITRLDQVNKIVSGTFWFDAIDTISNTTVQIREGRFDLHYTE